METEVCGLVSGPSWLRASLTVDLLDLGYQKNPYDKCVYTLKSDDPKGENEGHVLLDVDDFIEGGSDRHRRIFEKFYSKYNCEQDCHLDGCWA